MRSGRQWTLWIAVGLGLDVLTSSGLSQLRIFRGGSTLAAAATLCWVHAFLLPQLVGRPWRQPFRVMLGAGAGLIVTLFAIILGGIAGYYTFILSIAILEPISVGAAAPLGCSFLAGAVVSALVAVLAAAAIPGTNFHASPGG